MNRFPLLFLLLAGAPLFANDNGGEYIPDYRELAREGYGPVYIEHHQTFQTLAKPTQAFYGSGYAIYYGYTALPASQYQASGIYAFGYPADFFRQLAPDSLSGRDLGHYAVQVRRPIYAAGEYVAQRQASSSTAVTMVRKAKSATVAATSAPSASALPAVAEKSSGM